LHLHLLKGKPARAESTRILHYFTEPKFRSTPSSEMQHGAGLRALNT
jgi:hypothetical protein